MKKFHLHIKTHCEAPDFELEVNAKNRENAVKQITRMYGDLDERIVEDNIEEMED